MRDPARIEKVLSGLRVYWHQHPDLRLGQIVSNMSPEQRLSVFYLEDDLLLEQLLKASSK